MQEMRFISRQKKLAHTFAYMQREREREGAREGERGGESKRRGERRREQEKGGLVSKVSSLIC